MPKTAKEVVRILKKAGWVEVRQSGSHRMFEHDIHGGLVVVAMHNRDVPVGTLAELRRLTGLEELR